MIAIDPASHARFAADVVVVGSGPGGSAAAATLSESGRDVLLLEAGDHHDPSTFDQREETMFPRLYAEGGAQTTADQAMLVTTGRGLGGSSIHNTGLCVPPPPAILDRFEREGGLAHGRAAIEEAVRDATARLLARPMNAADENRSNALLAEGATRVGLSWTRPLHNREVCDRCGFCILGCAYNRKRNAVFAYLEDATRAGLRVATRAEARRISSRGGDWVVSGPGFEARARRVIVAAGALRTPALLIGSGLDFGGTLGRNLRLHPFAPVGALFDETIDADRGIPQSVLVTGGAKFLEGRPGGFILMAAAAPPASTAAFLQGRGADVREVMINRRRLASAGVLLHDETPSRVRAGTDGRAVVSAWPRGTDLEDLREGVATLARLWFAAGARRVLTPFRRRPFLASEAEVGSLRDLPIRPYDVLLTSVHPQASAPIGRDEKSPVRSDGSLRGARGVYVADGSLFPSSVGVPPQVSIAAFATVVARGIAAEAVS